MSTGLNPWEIVTEDTRVIGPRVGATTEERLSKLETQTTLITIGVLALALGVAAYGGAFSRSK